MNIRLTSDWPDIPRIPYGSETRAPWGRDGRPCHDCGVPVGQVHKPGCDIEECPICNDQMISCGCPPDEDVKIHPAEEEEG